MAEFETVVCKYPALQLQHYINNQESDAYRAQNGSKKMVARMNVETELTAAS